MPYQYLDDIALADAAYEAWGESVEELFSEAAEAFLRVMVGDPATVLEKERRGVRVADTALDMLLLQALQELIFLKDSERLLLRLRKIRIHEVHGRYTLEAEAAGEAIDPLRHDLIVDVKAVTLHRLRVEKTPLRWEATVILDI